MRVSVAFNPNIPYYYQIKQDLLRRIEAGEWAPGDRLPNELRLADFYGVSRPTVRQAIQELVQEGRLVRRRGKGTFVNPPLITDTAEAFTIFAELGGGESWSEVLTTAEREPTEAIRRELRLGADDRVYEVVTRRRNASEHLAVRTFHIPVALAPGLPDRLAAKGLNRALMDDFRLVPAGAVQRFQAVRVKGADAALLGVRPGVPGILWQGVLLAEAGQPLAWVRTVFRGDRFCFVIRQGKSVLADGPAVGTDGQLDIGRHMIW